MIISGHYALAANNVATNDQISCSEQSKKAAKKEAAKEEKLCHRLHELHARIMVMQVE
jgi:hypothetical protein